MTGIDAPSVATSSNTLLPAVSAKFSLRVPPGQDPQQAFEALRRAPHAHAPWGAQVEVTLGEAGQPWRGDLDGPVYDVARWALERAWDRAPVHMGVGGSIPFVAALKEVYPQATVLLTGVEDPDTRAHGTNESVHLQEFERACLAETLLLAALAALTARDPHARRRSRKLAGHVDRLAPCSLLAPAGGQGPPRTGRSAAG